MLLRRYLKIVYAECATAEVLDCSLGDARIGQLPFDVRQLPREFPSLADLRM